ncbi:MAG: LacI family DNA-binding transcriptional regulator, partial [Chloroflexota bacterium]
MITIQDVATAAGVSLSTVSRALANSPRVKAETRHRIQQLAEEMGYIPSAIARGLATRRTYTLGIVVMDITDPFIAELVRAIDMTAVERGYSLILSHCGSHPERELAAINTLRRHHVDAVIVPDPMVSDTVLPRLQEYNFPVVLINVQTYAHAICTDNIGGVRLAVEYLLDLGHTRIAYLGSQRNERENSQRQAGYKQAITDRGLPPGPIVIGQGDGWMEAGRSGMAQLLTLPQPPTAVLCFNDLSAIAAMGAARSAALRVPQDISIVGFDNINLSPYLDPP